MKERGIPFNGPMVRAILEDRKTQTRRLVKYSPSPKLIFPLLGRDNTPTGEWFFTDPVYDRVGHSGHYCPYGKLGDRLWVREAWTPGYQEGCWGTIYREDGAFARGKRKHEKGPYFNADEIGLHIRWRPSIHMPRWASRITLEITDARVQRVQEISEEDAQAEGVERWVIGEGWREYGLSPAEELTVGPPMPTARDSFRTLWTSVAKPSFKWEANPWVWAVSFKRLQQ